MLAICGIEPIILPRNNKGTFGTTGMGNRAACGVMPLVPAVDTQGGLISLGTKVTGG